MTGTRRRACTGKKSHSRRQDADAHRNRLIEQGAAPDGIRVYRCRHCGFLHIGHSGPTGKIHR